LFCVWDIAAVSTERVKRMSLVTTLRVLSAARGRADSGHPTECSLSRQTW
jgi:hypothetical protein